MIWPFSRTNPIVLPADMQARRERLQSAKAVSAKLPLNTLRWVVVDVETGGLNALADPLLSIGALEIQAGQIKLGGAFEAELLQSVATSSQNILLHGLTHTRQLSGRAPREVLLDFAEYAEGAVLVAFHAGFDRTVLQSAMRRELGLELNQPWLDAAVLAPILFPHLASGRKHLDDWLGAFGISNFSRHSAVADAAATAQLWQILMRAAQEQHCMSLRAMQKLCLSRKWLGG